MSSKVSRIDDYLNENSRARKGKRGRNTRRDKQAENLLTDEFRRDRQPKPLTLKTQNQKRFYQLLQQREQVVVFGPSGVGKTYVAICHAAELYLTGRIKKIVITRPIVGVGKSIGALPGEKDDKMKPWLAEVMHILEERLGKGTVETAMKHGEIEIAALEHIRGRSFAETFIFMTESQNTTIDEMMALVTRVGEGSQIVLDGDIRQTDLKGENGLLWAIEKIRDTPALYAMSGVIEFSVDDIVRSGLCAAWVRAIWGGR